MSKSSCGVFLHIVLVKNELLLVLVLNWHKFSYMSSHKHNINRIIIEWKLSASAFTQFMILIQHPSPTLFILWFRKNIQF